VMINLDKNIDALTHLDRIPGEIGRLVDLITGKQPLEGPLPGAGVGTNLGGGRGGPPPVTPGVIKEGTKPTKDAITTMQGKLDPSIQRTRASLHAKLSAVEAAEKKSAVTFREGERASTAASLATKAAVNTSKNAIVANDRGEQAKARAKLSNVTANVQNLKGAVTGQLATANSRLAAIRAKRTSFTVNVPVHTSVTVRNVNTSTNTSNNYSTRSRSWVK
jgi:hypothetical protein